MEDIAALCEARHRAESVQEGIMIDTEAALLRGTMSWRKRPQACLLVAGLFWIVAPPALAQDATSKSAPESLPSIPTEAVATVDCIHRILKSSSAVESINMYSIDGYRFALEYTFRDKDGDVFSYDMEMLPSGEGAVFVTDKVPREVSEKAINEAQDLESRLDLNSKCHLSFVLDNLMPPPSARADWRKIDFLNK